METRAAPQPPLRFSHCEVPPWRIASVEFQDRPQPLLISDVLITEKRLWEALAHLHTPQDRARHFHDYVSVKFSLHAWSDPEHTAAARASLRHSYVHCLRHWLVDSNGPSGAALKAWAESRFGLRPTYHAGLLANDPEARDRFLYDRMRATAKAAGLFQQFDLLQTFCQQELARRHPGQSWLTLYRGTQDADDYRTLAAEAEGVGLIECNNVSSFTSDSEVAWEFGSSVWAVQVPITKVVCFSGLLPPEFLQGESEYLVLGGMYRVRRLIG